MSSSGGLTSSTTGVPPWSATARATAAPRPEAPPVTMTVPRSGEVPSAGTGDGLLDELGGRAPGHVRHEHDAAAPGGQGLRLRQVGARVVAALDPDVRTQALQRPRRLVLFEDQDGVHAG